ncbi:uncharacterized protein LOC134234664 [Saccostrea cucullata]|uniref:uncharacterized protein LOC134234664 n=1 Tax=Saccostrea cuccullata TaxID=36930 RepID=UPI002ED4FA42
MINNMNTNEGPNCEIVVQNLSNKIKKKGKDQQKLYTLSIITIMVSVVTIVVSFPNVLVGTLIMTFRGNVKLPHSPTGTIWSGALVLVCGIQCLLLSWMGIGYIEMSSPFSLSQVSHTLMEFNVMCDVMHLL